MFAFFAVYLGIIRHQDPYTIALNTAPLPDPPPLADPNKGNDISRPKAQVKLNVDPVPRGPDGGETLLHPGHVTDVPEATDRRVFPLKQRPVRYVLDARGRPGGGRLDWLHGTARRDDFGHRIHRFDREMMPIGVKKITPNE